MLGGPGGGVGGVRLAGLVYRVPGEGEMRACARATSELKLVNPLFSVLSEKCGKGITFKLAAL